MKLSFKFILATFLVIISMAGGELAAAEATQPEIAHAGLRYAMILLIFAVTVIHGAMNLYWLSFAYGALFSFFGLGWLPAQQHPVIYAVSILAFFFILLRIDRPIRTARNYSPRELEPQFDQEARLSDRSRPLSPAEYLEVTSLMSEDAEGIELSDTFEEVTDDGVLNEPETSADSPDLQEILSRPEVHRAIVTAWARRSGYPTPSETFQHIQHTQEAGTQTEPSQFLEQEDSEQKPASVSTKRKVNL